MELMTKIDIPVSNWEIDYRDHILLLGSCFANNMNAKLEEYFFQTKANPTGTLYNPISIAHHMHDDEVLTADVIIVTFGTAWVYELNGQVVDNCQKRPASIFVRRRLTVDDIVSAWRPILERYREKRFIFTVSPIRHIKDGLHENQISKGILLQAVDQIVRGSIAPAAYFPSYEILMDELRDYRFYASDMLHPSETAINYLWEKFRHTYIYSPRTRDSMHELHQLWLNEQHRSLHPDSEEDREFRRKVEVQRTTLKRKYTWL